MNEQLVNELKQALGLPHTAATVFVARGITTPEQVEQCARYDINDLPDPFLLPDMVPAVDRINRAIDTGEHAHVIADSDVDGICAAAIIINTLRRLRVHIRAYRKSLWLLKILTSVGSGSLRISGEVSSAEERKGGSASSGIKQKMTFSICSKKPSTNKLFHFDRACFSSDFRLEQLFP